MSSVAQKKDLYVGTVKHRWWKEAVVYQVQRFGPTCLFRIDTDIRFILPRF